LSAWRVARWNELMTEFVDRKVAYYDLPLTGDIAMLSIEKVVLVYEKGYSIDFGSLCYLRRSDQRRKPGHGCPVDLSSFDETRCHQVRVLIECVSERQKYSGNRPITLHGCDRTFTRFIDWCDLHHCSDCLANEMQARAAFGSYVDDLRRLVDQNQLSINSAVDYQDFSQKGLESYFNVENLGQGINLLVGSNRANNPTPVPDDDSQEKLLAWCKCLLEGFCQLVVDQKYYPFALTVPGYMNWPDNRLWIFPTKNWYETPDTKRKAKFRAYDFQNGVVRTGEEIEHRYGKSDSHSGNLLAVKKAKRLIARSNQDFYSADRIERGILAMNAFLILFIACTACNSTPAVETPWSEELEEVILNPSVERQHFRMIKYRANNLLVTFEIGVQYMPYLRRFLQLRNYLLMGKRSNYLFFSYGPNLRALKTGPVPAASWTIQRILGKLKRMIPALRTVTPKEWRAAKQNYVIRNYDPATAARIMQHSQETALRKYSNGSEVSQQIELSSFFSQVEKVVLKRGEEIPGSETNSVGVCISPNNPKSIGDYPPVIPSCQGAEGCLFCDQCRVHADDTDTRKLLSARYCIRKISHLASSIEHFDLLFGGVLQRIDFILMGVKRHDLKMVERIEREVDMDGELDVFWSNKLEMLMELELV